MCSVLIVHSFWADYLAPDLDFPTILRDSGSVVNNRWKKNRLLKKSRMSRFQGNNWGVLLLLLLFFFWADSGHNYVQIRQHRKLVGGDQLFYHFSRESVTEGNSTKNQCEKLARIGWKEDVLVKFYRKYLYFHSWRIFCPFW